MKKLHQVNTNQKQTRNSLVPAHQNFHHLLSDQFVPIKSIGSLTPNGLKEHTQLKQFQRKASHLLENQTYQQLPILGTHTINSMKPKPQSSQQTMKRRIRQSLNTKDNDFIASSLRNRQINNSSIQIDKGSDHFQQRNTSMVSSFQKIAQFSRQMNPTLDGINKLQLYQDRSFTVLQTPLDNLTSGQISPIIYQNGIMSAKNLSNQSTGLINQEARKKIFQRVKSQKREIQHKLVKKYLDLSSLQRSDFIEDSQNQSSTRLKLSIDRNQQYFGAKVKSPYEIPPNIVSPNQKFIPLHNQNSQFSRNTQNQDVFSNLMTSRSKQLKPQALIQLRSQQVLDQWQPESIPIQNVQKSKKKKQSVGKGIEKVKDQSVSNHQIIINNPQKEKLTSSSIYYDNQLVDSPDKKVAEVNQNKFQIKIIGNSANKNPNFNEQESKASPKQIEVAEKQKDEDPSIFSFTFNRDAEKQQPLLSAQSVRKIEETGFEDFQTPAQKHTENKQAHQIQDTQIEESKKLQIRIRPISQVKDRNQQLLSQLSSNHSEYSNKNMNSGGSSSANRAGSKTRPTSGMNQYLKGKLPDCFLLDSQPQFKKSQLSNPSQTNNQIMSPSNGSQYQVPIQSYVSNNDNGLSPSVQLGAGGSDANRQTRMHSAQTYINYPTSENQVEQGVQLNRRVGLVVSRNDLMAPSIINFNPNSQTTSCVIPSKKPAMQKKLLGPIFTKNNPVEIKETILYAQSSRASASTKQFQ